MGRRRRGRPTRARRAMSDPRRRRVGVRRAGRFPRATADPTTRIRGSARAQRDYDEPHFHHPSDGSGSRGRGAAQDDLRDLERRAEPHGRTPIAAAARDVQLRAIVLVPAGEQAALLELHDVVPRPDLAAVGVSGQLQIDAVLRRFLYLSRLVREQDQRAARVAAGGCRAEILAVAGPFVRTVIVDACELEARTRICLLYTSDA